MFKSHEAIINNWSLPGATIVVMMIRVYDSHIVDAQIGGIAGIAWTVRTG